MATLNQLGLTIILIWNVSEFHNFTALTETSLDDVKHLFMIM